MGNLKRFLILHVPNFLMISFAFIITKGEKGVYHRTICPPLYPALAAFLGNAVF